MASVFLSYSRDDTDRARPLAAALEKAGHSVWWDLNVRSGAQFSKVIEEALKAADAVVVLWSVHSVDSPWVRDEAAAGRDSGRLVPVTVDGTEPPLGFRQFQTIDLRKWSGRRSSAQLRALFSDIEALAFNRSGAPPPPPAAASSSAAASSAVRRGLLVPAVALLALVAAAVLYWFLGGRTSGPPTVAVAAADAMPLSKDLSSNLLVKLGALQGSSSANLRLLGQSGGDPNADLRFTVGGAERGGQIHANIALISGKNIMLWSKQFEQPIASRSDLEESLAFAAGRVLGCAIDEASGKHGRLKDRGRQMYLNACATLTEIGWDTRPVIAQLRAVVRESPKFRPAWASLLMAEANAVSWLRSTGNESVETARRDLRADIARAREVDPDIAEATLAELDLMPKWTLERAAALVEKAKSQNPDNAFVLSARIGIMESAGRMGEAVEDAAHAAESDPLSPNARSALIRSLAYAGRIDRAREELERAKKLWPRTQTIQDAEFALELRFGDFEKVLRSEPIGPGGVIYLTARREPSEANVRSFLTYTTKRLDERGIVGLVLQGLGEMSRVDDFYNLVEQRTVVDALGSESYILFRPWLSNVRRDPRFIRLAKRIGLVNYWRQSGHWPDYCNDPELPYDCQAEAAKYG